MTIRKELLTSDYNKVVIESSDEKIVKHFTDPRNFTDVIIHQINNDRLYDNMLKGKRDIVVLDLGGNVGLFTLYIQDRAKAVYTVEPTPAHFGILSELTKPYKNVTLINAALHNKDGTVKFNLSETNTTTNNTFMSHGGESVDVAAIRLGTILKTYNIDHIDFVKCDIEGSELLALTDDTVGEVKDKIDTWFLEIHGTNTGSHHDNREIIKGVFERNGYQVQYHQNDGLFCVKIK